MFLMNIFVPIYTKYIFSEVILNYAYKILQTVNILCEYQLLVILFVGPKWGNL